MSRLRAYFVRLAGVFSKQRRDRDFAEELESNLSMHIEDNLQAGMTPEEARRQALIKLGGIEHAKEQYRDRLGVPGLESVIQDLRYGLRQLRRNPGFTAIAVGILALGIGANAAMFSVLDAVLIRPLPYKDPDRIISIDATVPQGWEKTTKTIKSGSTYEQGPVNLIGTGWAERISAAEVSKNFFSALGVQPSEGRTFLPSEENRSGPSVAILSDALWRSRYSSDPRLIGKNIEINGTLFTVIGIMPPSFHFPGKTQLWAPMPLNFSQELFGGNAFFWNYVGRLRPGITLDQARAELTAILLKAYPKMDRSRIPRPIVASLRSSLVFGERSQLFVLFGAVGFVLLISCADVANLLLSRNAGRVRELAVRTALGSSRGRLVRQLLTESLLLSLIGAALGLVVAWWVMLAARLLIPAGVLLVGEIRMDGWVLAFTLLASLLTGTISGILPALSSRRIAVPESLKGAEGDTQAAFGLGHLRILRTTLGVAEVALALTLLTGAGLLVKSFARLLEVNPGFRSGHLLTARVFLPARSPVAQTGANPCGGNNTPDSRKFSQPGKEPGSTEPAGGTGAASRAGCSSQHTLSAAAQQEDETTVRRTYFQQMLARTKALPGVRDAAFINILPFGNAAFAGFPIRIAGKPKRSLPPFEVYVAVSPDYFRTMDIPLLSGRFFTDADGPGASNVAIINQTMARLCWPGTNPIGKLFTSPLANGKSVQVVGVVGDVRDFGLDSEPFPEMYFSIYQQVQDAAYLVMRTAQRPATLVPAVRAVASSVGQLYPLSSFDTMKELISRSSAQPRFRTALLGMFAALALLLATAGIYGVISYSTAQRRHEFAVRIALGAQRRDVTRLVVRQGLCMTLVGMGLGILGALGLGRLLAHELFAVKPTDPETFVVVALLMAGAALLACYLPARRATQVDPIGALKYE